MNLTLLTTAIAAAVSGVAGFGLAWQLQAGNLSELELNYANERIAVQNSIRTALAANQRQVDAAQVTARKRDVRVRVDSDRSRNAAGGLRLATEATVRTAAADTATCDSIIAAYSAVVNASGEFVQAVAADADQCHSDLTLMTEAWPR